MAVVFNDIGLAWDLKKLFGEEAEEEAWADVWAEEERADVEGDAAANFAVEWLHIVNSLLEAVCFVKLPWKYARSVLHDGLYIVRSLLEAVCCVKLNGLNWGGCPSLFIYLAASVYANVYRLPACTYPSVTSNVLPGRPCFYSCLCYPKEELKKEDEEWCGPRYEHVLALLPKMFHVLAIKRIYNEEPLPKMFNDWAMTHGKRYESVYEWRLRFKIWCAAKKVIEHRCSRTGQTFSIEKMNSSADETAIERERFLGYIPSKVPLSEVKMRILKKMGKGWMKKVGEGFEEWAERHKRVYSSTEEREERRLAYLENMRGIELEEKYHPGLWEYGNDLENMDKFEWEDDLIPPAPCSRCRPRKYRSN